MQGCAVPRGVQDRSIGRVVWQIEGAVPASNYVVLPRDRGDSLALTGRFLYLQVISRCPGRAWHPCAATYVAAQTDSAERGRPETCM